MSRLAHVKSVLSRDFRWVIQRLGTDGTLEDDGNGAERGGGGTVAGGRGTAASQHRSSE